MTDLTNPRATVAALLQDVHALMNNMQAAADQLQHWLNATADLPVAALPAAPVLPVVLPAPVVAAAPAKRGRKPKEKHLVLEALLRMSKFWTARSHLRDVAVLVTPLGVRNLPGAAIYWNIPCNTGLDAGCAAVSGKELLDAMKRAGANAQLTAAPNGLQLTVIGDVTVSLHAHGEFIPSMWDEQDKLLGDRPPHKVTAHGKWTSLTCEELVRVSRVCSKDTTRPNLNHVLVDAAGYAVATDGHRLEARPITHDGESLLIPASVMSSLSTCEGAVFWEASERHIRIIDADGAGFTFERSTDLFPDWRRVMPKAGQGAKVFAFSVDREALLLRTKVKAQHLPHWRCQLSGDELRVEERGGDGATTFTIPVEVLHRPADAECLHFGVDYTYLRDMCEGYDSKHITLFVEDSFAPLLCSKARDYESAAALDHYGPTTTHIVMPVRV